MKKRVAIGQAGGPTAVINASLAGFIDGLEKEAELFAVYNGYQGLAENDIEQLDETGLSWVKAHRKLNGACLGSGRYSFCSENIESGVRHLQEHGITTLVFIGGNGTMAALKRIADEAKRMNYSLQVIGIPKTVDNDLACTDHAPGFGSAARYVAASVRDISLDLASMRNFEQVRILETMGRNAGWLAAAGGMLSRSEEDAPHIICVPERVIDPVSFIDRVKHAVSSYGYASVVVSEGCRIGGGHEQIAKASVGGRTVLGGISAELEDLVRDELGVMARAELLGMNQRSFSLAVSEQDRIEAEAAGREAARLVSRDESGRMVTIQRSPGLDYTFYMDSCLLHEAAEGGERLLPAAFIDNPAAYYDWLRPLAGEDLLPNPPERRRRTTHEEYKYSALSTS